MRVQTRCAAGFLLAIGAVLALPTPASNGATATTIRVAGHRGYSSAAPENTVEAAKLAIKVGADGLEFDVRYSSTNYPVVVHDSTLGRTTECSGYVHKKSVTSLRSCNAGSWFQPNYDTSNGHPYPDAHVPGFHEYMKAIAAEGYKGTLFIELKTRSTGARAGRLWARIPTSLRDQVVFISFSRARLQDMYAVAGRNVKYAWIFQTQEGWTWTGIGSDYRWPYGLPITPVASETRPIVGTVGSLSCDCLSWVVANNIPAARAAVDNYTVSGETGLTAAQERRLSP